MNEGIRHARNDLICVLDADCVLQEDALSEAVKHFRNDEVVAVGGRLLVKREDSSQIEAIQFCEYMKALGAKVCEKNGVEVESTLTGFKFIGDKIREYEGKKEFLFGYEESYGYMIKPFTRDKDGVQSTILACEAVNYYKTKNKTLVDVLNSWYDEFGYLEDIQENETLLGIEGLAEIRRRVEEFRTQDIKGIEGRKVVKKVDYKDGVQGLPPSNVIKLFLEDGSWVVIRPSGNEPKIKY